MYGCVGVHAISCLLRTPVADTGLHSSWCSFLMTCTVGTKILNGHGEGHIEDPGRERHREYHYCRPKQWCTRQRLGNPSGQQMPMLMKMAEGCERLERVVACPDVWFLPVHPRSSSLMCFAAF